MDWLKFWDSAKNETWGMRLARKWCWSWCNLDLIHVYPAQNIAIIFNHINICTAYINPTDLRAHHMLTSFLLSAMHPKDASSAEAMRCDQSCIVRHHGSWRRRTRKKGQKCACHLVEFYGHWEQNLSVQIPLCCF